MRFEITDNALVCRRRGETLRIEPWGRDSLRVRAAMGMDVLDIPWALTEAVEKPQAKISVYEVDHWAGDGTIDKRPEASIENGRVKAVVNFAGVVTYLRDGKKILREYYRTYCMKVAGTEDVAALLRKYDGGSAMEELLRFYLK